MKNNPPKVYIVVPAYNEEEVIKKTISSLKNAGYHNIVVVDDCSSDETGHKATEAGATVLTHIINRGYGAALRTGIDYVRDYTDAEMVVTFDADGQHQAKDIKKFIDTLANNRYDIVLGSRFLGSTKNISIIRKLILKCGIIFTTIMSGIHLTDTHNGFRALNRKAMSRIKTCARGMEYASEIIDEIKRKKLRHTEVPVTIIYTDYSMEKGQSSFNALKIAAKILIKKILV